MSASQRMFAQAILFAEFAVTDILRDPMRFMDKVAMRHDRPPFNWMTRVLRTVIKGAWGKPALNLVANGEFDKAFIKGRTGFLGRLSASLRWSELILDARELKPARKAKPHRGQLPRVLFYVTNSFPHSESGYAVRTHAILKTLVQMGVPVLAVTRSGYPIVVGKLGVKDADVIDGVEYRRLIPRRFSLDAETNANRAAHDLASIAQDFQANVIHTTTSFPNALVAAKAARELSIPWVYEVRGEEVETWISKSANDGERKTRSASLLSRLWADNEREAIRAASGTVFLSEVSRKHFGYLDASSHTSLVLRNSIHLEDSKQRYNKETVRSELGGFESARYWFGSVSSVVSYEGFDCAIDALDYLPPCVGFLLVGDGQDLERLENRVREKKLGDRVRLVGRKPPQQIGKWYASLDAFVVPRVDLDVCRRVTPIKAQQAIALGLPVIASDLPALREVTGGGEFYFQPGSAEGLAAAIYKAITEPQERDEEWISKQTWEAGCERLLDFYNDVLAEGVESEKHG